jgi:flavin-dependent dehydrogenase
MRQDVVIAGSGVAAAAVATRLLVAGYSVLLLRKPTSAKPGVEVLPPEARHQVLALGWTSVFDEAGAVIVEGFENHWNTAEPTIKPGRFVHVERTSLARAALAFVIRQGARVLDVRSLPRLESKETTGVSITHGGVNRRFLAAVDATGRAAAWSRPVRRQGRQIADLFEGPSDALPLRGRVVSDFGGDGWAYRAGLVDSTTVGVIGRPGGSRPELDLSSARALDVPAGRFRFVGRRPSFPQWASDPVRGLCFAVGDAAFASDPLAGQGIRFAMASGIAAATAIDALVRSEFIASRFPQARPFAGQEAIMFNSPALASDYYRDFVNSARARHLRAVASLRAGSTTPPEAIRLPATLCFTARPRMAALSQSGALGADIAYELPDGGLVRWLGPFDLRRLAHLASAPVPSNELAQRLRAEGLSPPDAQKLIFWCVSHKVLE